MHRVNGYTYRNKLHHSFHELLCSEAEKRDQREDWPTVERTAMWEAVNRHRTQVGKERLPIEDVERVEQMAVGHTDYGTKYALYCTELVEDTP
jgi:hypothetical protein